MEKFKLTQSAEEIQSDLNVIENLISEYNPDEFYVKNDIVRHNSKIYLCYKDTTGEFNYLDWTNCDLEYLLDKKVNRSEDTLPIINSTNEENAFEFVQNRRLFMKSGILRINSKSYLSSFNYNIIGSHRTVDFKLISLLEDKIYKGSMSRNSFESLTIEELISDEYLIKYMYVLDDSYTIKPISDVYAKVDEIPFFINNTYYSLKRQNDNYFVKIANPRGYGTHIVNGETTIETIFDGDPYQNINVQSGDDFNTYFDERLYDKGYDYSISNFRIDKTASDEIEIHFPKGIMIKEIIFDIGDKSYDLVFTAYNVSNLRNSGTAELGMESLYDETYTDEGNNFVNVVFSSQFDTTKPVKVHFIQYEKILGMAEI